MTKEQVAIKFLYQSKCWEVQALGSIDFKQN